MSKRKAFTLVELLVVISIIALLLAVLMPALSKAREQGKKLVCQTNLKTLGPAMLVYAADNSGIFLSQDWTGGEGSVNPPSNYWFYKIAPYIGEKSQAGIMSKFFRCPSGLSIKEFGNKPPSGDWKSIDIGLHWYGGVSNNGTSGKYGKVSNIKQAGEFASFFDFYYGSLSYGDVATMTGKYVGGTIYASKYQCISYRKVNNVKFSDYLYRHRGNGQRGINAVYLDGHIGFINQIKSMDGVTVDKYWQYEWRQLTGNRAALGRDLEP